MCGSQSCGDDVNEVMMNEVMMNVVMNECSPPASHMIERMMVEPEASYEVIVTVAVCQYSNNIAHFMIPPPPFLLIVDYYACTYIYHDIISPSEEHLCAVCVCGNDRNLPGKSRDN
jgi:hypothetical protein